MAVILHSHLIDKLAFFNSFLSGVALYPQAWAVIKSGSAAGMSLATFLIIMFNSVVWLLYSMHRGLLSLGIASILNIIASGILSISVLIF